MKNQIEGLAASRKDFQELITAAQHWLLAREASFTTTGNNPPTARISFFIAISICLYKSIYEEKQNALNVQMSLKFYHK